MTNTFKAYVTKTTKEGFSFKTFISKDKQHRLEKLFLNNFNWTWAKYQKLERAYSFERSYGNSLVQTSWRCNHELRSVHLYLAELFTPHRRHSRPSQKATKNLELLAGASIRVWFSSWYTIPHHPFLFHNRTFWGQKCALQSRAGCYKQCFSIWWFFHGRLSIDWSLRSHNEPD